MCSIDCDKLPPSPGVDGAFLEMLISDEIAKLFRLHAAISKWHDWAKIQLGEFQRRMETKRTDKWDVYDYDPVRDEAAALLNTERAMWGSFAVAVTAIVEHVMEVTCVLRHIGLSDRADWGAKKGKIESALQIQFKAISGVQEATRARLLANCFKHRGGKTDAEWVKMYPDDRIDADLEYEREDWLGHVKSVRTFLTSLSSHV
jgi:hypothetical protein